MLGLDSAVLPCRHWSASVGVCSPRNAGRPTCWRDHRGHRRVRPGHKLAQAGWEEVQCLSEGVAGRRHGDPVPNDGRGVRATAFFDKSLRKDIHRGSGFGTQRLVVCHFSYQSSGLSDLRRFTILVIIVGQPSWEFAHSISMEAAGVQ